MGEAAALKTPVLVLGATSLVGRFVLPRLAGTPHVAVSRTPPQGGAGTWVQADLDDPELKAALPVCPTALSLLPIWLLPPALPALRARGMERLVAFSSTSVFTKPDSPVSAERDVARLLAEGEATIRAFCEANDVAWTILRPTLIYAEGQDQNVSRLAKLIGKLGFLPLAGRGDGRRQPVHADDLAGAALAAAASDAARNEAFDVPGGETLTYRRMAERVFEGLGRRPRILTIPPQVWTVGLRLAGPLLPGATAGMGARMSEDLVFDPEPARRAFGWAPRDFRPRF